MSPQPIVRYRSRASLDRFEKTFHHFFFAGKPRIRVHYELFHADQEDTIGKPAKTTLAKRDREKAKQMKQREKEARRVQRKAEKTDRHQTTNGEDPDLAGLHWGPQEPLY